MMPDPFEMIPAAAVGEYCMAFQLPAEQGYGYCCTEEPGHGGWHRAEFNGELLETWPQKGHL